MSSRWRDPEAEAREWITTPGDEQVPPGERLEWTTQSLAVLLRRAVEHGKREGLNEAQRIVEKWEHDRLTDKLAPTSPVLLIIRAKEGGRS
jgi:hypothetical protein